MSAINEWFGIYNMIFRSIRSKYGDEVLDDYLEYISKTAYNDISAEYRAKGLAGILERYKTNFQKDCGLVMTVMSRDAIEIDVLSCPAFQYMLLSDNPYDQPEAYFCTCCNKLNRWILHNAGYKLLITGCLNNGLCHWHITSDSL